MTNTQKVIGFLDIFGQWDPDLVFVMGSAVVTTFLGFKFVLNAKQKPIFGELFSIPTRSDIDLKLILGASLFGVGWGLYGYCPGPAIASIVYLSPITLLFLVFMFLGMQAGNLLSKKI
ncbi:UNVERIFIED_CONTAM: hypothetical protein GTU68_014498 [Idotea baltica]|nr:hypothetical protein [Idotea baltica]